MEEALSIHFLDSTILFSLIYKNYEKNLQKELWLCHEHMNLSYDELYKMPIQNRKYIIKLHNESVEKQKQSMKQSRGR